MQNCLKTALGVLLPFFGTAIGAAAVFFKKKDISQKASEMLFGFASGVMIAASVWSLLLPSIELSADYGRLRFLPAVAGLIAGSLLLLALDRAVPALLARAKKETRGSKHTLMLILAVTLHNLPEGMAVGVAFAGALENSAAVSFSGAAALSLGVALQNLPEGAIVSLPAAAEGCGKTRAFFTGVLSGAVEPVGALLAILLSSFSAPILPYMLSLSAGAMLVVVTGEMIPRAHEGEDAAHATVSLIVGFALMMLLDVALG